jgi:hypothetical protein
MTVSSLKWLDRFATGQAPISLQTVGQQALNGLGRLTGPLFAAAPATNATADELFDRAAAYEATQPGYAEDLRAAARRAQARHLGGG